MNEQSIGATLAQARRAAGLTVGQLSASTRIREALIYGIERDDFSQCGGDFYTRGHVRSLAKAVGLDPDTMAHLYDEQHGGIQAPVSASAVFKNSKGIKLRERRGPNWTMALGVALAIVVVFGVVRVFGGPAEIPAAEIRPVNSVPSVPAGKPVSVAPRAPVAQSTTQKDDLVVVRIKAKRSSYLNVHDSTGRKLFSGTLQAGKTTTWQAAKQVRLLIGDAGAVLLQVNGKNLGAPGARGEMVRRSFGPSVPRPR
ncbi:RodZ domain-containing protein [Nonomuraea sp. NPDC046570]|uniref:helix-turn-helix domain-containing protein n=1 Tax=Nonomuraea sp. NPDC046570 TaxID=3155255 RepID=UPI0033D946EA